MTSKESPGSVSNRIDALIATPRLKALVSAYFDPAGPFAAASFDTLEPGSPNRIDIGDLLAVTLLDIRLRPLAVRQILDDKQSKIQNLLAKLPTTTPIWAASDEILDGHATGLWTLLRSLPGVGPVTTSKLLARKRPHLIPVLDSVVLTALGMDWKDSWRELRTALQSRERRERVEELRPPDLDEAITTLRVLDVAIWMRHSNSTNAKRAREHVTSAID